MSYTIGLISVILPTYNEAENIVPLAEAIDHCIAEPHEIIVVDDNSPDGTSRIVAEVIASGRLPALRLETRLADRGLTKSLWRGIELARGDVIVWMDCDFSHPPAIIPLLLQQITEGHAIAVASRFMAGGKQKSLTIESGDSRLGIVISSIGAFLMRYLLFPSFLDYTSGFLAIRREVFEKIRLHGNYGEYFIDLIVRAKLLGIRTIEIPFAYDARRSGTSKTAPTLRLLLLRCIQYGRQVLRMEWVRLRYILGGSITDGDALPPR
ncbi:MAG: glycosyltransferase [Candidatus Peregrinibacteria bacterium]